MSIMTAEMQALARRAVACKAWRWLPGMLCLNHVRVTGVRTLNNGTVRVQTTNGQLVNLLPDLTDPATLGCLLALVREAWGEPTLTVTNDGSPDEVGTEWWVEGDNGELTRSQDTEAHALVAALEARR